MPHNLMVHRKLFAYLEQLLLDVRRTTVRNLALMVSALQESRGIHLGQIGNALPGCRGKGPSLANRMHRFVCNAHVDVPLLYAPIACLLLQQIAQGMQAMQGAGSGPELPLVMDLTQAGRHCRMLTLSLAWRKRTLPLVWSVHKGTRGGVDYKAQIALLQQVAAWLPAGAQPHLLADAGFDSHQLLRWLHKAGWHYTLRRPAYHKVTLANGQRSLLAELPLRPGETRFHAGVTFPARRPLPGLALTITWRVGEKHPWYLLSSEATAALAIRRYSRRMQVEQMYADFKRHGFNLQASHLRHPERLARLVLLLAICYVWCMALGGWMVKNRKRHYVDVKSRRDKSYFRIGYDWLAYCRRIHLLPAVRFVFYL